MHISAGGRSALLTYCTNVHPADDLDGLIRALDGTTARVARGVAPDAPFGLGLRLGENQLAELERSAGERARFEEVLARHRFFVFTINGFPQARFHERRVKDAVYRPDWTRAVRTKYTLGLARLLAGWLPAGDRFGTISTVPVGWRRETRDRMEDAAKEIWALIDGLARIERESGARIMVCLEPEPDCAIETVAEAVEFFETMLRVRGAAVSGPGHSEGLLRRHLGVCYDLCHQAVLFADVEEDLAALRAAGIAIGKVQISNALRLRFDAPADLAALVSCDEERFLHQVAIRGGGAESGRRYSDLPDLGRGMAAGELEGSGEARCHFHVPIYAEAFSPLGTTRDDLLGSLRRIARSTDVRHFEVETYTFDVLPPSLRVAGIEAQLIREIEFARERLATG